jgi:hypothetical protein
LESEGLQFSATSTSFNTADHPQVIVDHAPAVAVEDVPGDFNRNLRLDADDIDQLSTAIRAAEFSGIMDLVVDGRLDDADRQRWVNELAATWFGDANLDGQFSSQDLVLVLQTGEYEDNLAANSGWADGDWDGNSDFDSSDLVAALQDGGYEQGPRVATAAVPEPAAAALIPWCVWLLSSLSAIRRPGHSREPRSRARLP